MNGAVLAIPAGLDPFAIGAAVAFAQWLLCAFLAFAAKRSSDGSLRRSHALFAVSTAVFLAAWLFVFRPPPQKPEIAAAAVVPVAEATGSCASLKEGMTGQRVKELVGEPDQVIDEEDVRGPGAAAWLYERSRCTVHLIDRRVDRID